MVYLTSLACFKVLQRPEIRAARIMPLHALEEQAEERCKEMTIPLQKALNEKKAIHKKAIDDFERAKMNLLKDKSEDIAMLLDEEIMPANESSKKKTRQTLVNEQKKRKMDVVYGISRSGSVFKFFP